MDGGEQCISSSRVEKYRVGHFVEGLGAQRLTGTIVRIEAEASTPDQPPRGPGTLFLKSDDGGDDVTTLAPLTAARLSASGGGRREIVVRSRPMGLAVHADPEGPTPTKLFKRSNRFSCLPVGSVLVEVQGKCVATWHFDRVLSAIKSAPLPIALVFHLPPCGGTLESASVVTPMEQAGLEAEDKQPEAYVAAAKGGAAAAAAAPAAPAYAASGPVIFTHKQLDAATSGFAVSNKLAEGTFGVVYKGVLETGCTIAVKVLKREALEAARTAIAEGRENQAEYMGAAGFHKELSVLGKYRHLNIVSLLGYLNLTSEEDGAAKWRAFSSPPKQCLVLEFMPGGSLKKRLASNSSERPLTAQERFFIASDIARGLEYLHVEANPTLIHQDVKTDNILLAHYDHGDGNRVCAKVSDFGTARYYRPKQQQDFHQTMNVVGTNAYMAPEYTTMGHVSEKTDSFAFGVVLLELLTGQPPADYAKGQMLWARMASVIESDEDELSVMFDSRLGGLGKWPLPDAIALARIARRCIYVDVTKRCNVRDVRVEVDKLAGRVAAPRAPRGHHFDPYTGKLVQVGGGGGGASTPPNDDVSTEGHIVCVSRDADEPHWLPSPVRDADLAARRLGGGAGGGGGGGQ